MWVRINFDHVCDYGNVKSLSDEGQTPCKERASIGWLDQASGRIGRVYCLEHAPEDAKKHLGIAL